MPIGRGFTLIELLVVVLIMGIALGLVSAIVRPGERDLLQLEAERLAELLDLAAAQANQADEPVAWTADVRTYRFWRLREDAGWLEIRDSDSLRPRTLPPGILISGLRVENMPHANMRLEFAPYGAPLSFIIQLSSGAEHRLVKGSPLGEVRVMPAEGKADAAAATR